MSFPVIDFHLHAHNPNFFADIPNISGGAHAYVSSRSKTSEILIDDTIIEMNKNNIKKGLISGIEVNKWLQKDPERFLMSFSDVLDFPNQDQNLLKFEIGIKEGKIFALGELGLAYAGLPLNSKNMYPFYEICEKYDIPVCFHAGLNGPSPQLYVSPKFKVELGNPLLLQDVIPSFPKVNFVLMHMGYPFWDNAMYMLYAYRNVYMDIAVTNWILGKRLFQRMLVETIDAVGNDRILFGSDQMVWPHMITKAVENVYSCNDLSNQDLENIMYKNAQTLLKISI